MAQFDERRTEKGQVTCLLRRVTRCRSHVRCRIRRMGRHKPQVDREIRRTLRRNGRVTCAARRTRRLDRQVTCGLRQAAARTIAGLDRNSTNAASRRAGHLPRTPNVTRTIARPARDSASVTPRGPRFLPRSTKVAMLDAGSVRDSRKAAPPASGYLFVRARPYLEASPRRREDLPRSPIRYNRRGSPSSPVLLRLPKTTARTREVSLAR